MNDQAEFDFITNSTATITDEKQDAFKSINDRLKTIEQRLGVLVPDEKLLEQYELLQSLYNQYAAAEALLYDGENNE